MNVPPTSVAPHTKLCYSATGGRGFTSEHNKSLPPGYHFSLEKLRSHVRQSHSHCKIGHVNQYPKMRYFGNPRHTQAIVAYMILSDFPEIPVKNCTVAMLLRCPIRGFFDMKKQPYFLGFCHHNPIDVIDELLYRQ